ncbi:Cytoskeletal signaling protein slm1 [Vanrija pseudolonga]|uniref:Cytoskeletal signaling protein slm1 n=1 Tax=Vanrija pseudolonga TaxID=143232 RepID=A0AAF0YGV9_9TREE|nr:Cytoskeletal signaling protein slm1 [Vanrija pseudolonga]
MSHFDTLSRTTSNGGRSTVSRSQSLIKKNTASHELKPSDILIERFTAWKQIVKMLISYFEGVADIEGNTSKELTKLAAVIQVPFRPGNQFLGEGGMQDVFYTIRDKTRVIADSHASLARTIESSIVQHLQKLRTEIKAHIKNVQNDTGKLAASVARERELSNRALADLARAVSAVNNTPMQISAKEDPYAVNIAVLKQLQRQVHEENALQKSIVIMQQNSAHFEEGIVRSIQSAWSTFDEWQSRMSVSVQETWRQLGVNMAQLMPDREWISFAARSDHLLDPETPLRNPDAIDYPGRNDPSVIPVHCGLLERKKRFTKTYREGYYVLTPAGFLHEYASSDPTTATHPIWSLFLPSCTLGPPSSATTAKSHKFHIETRKDGTSAFGKTPGKGLFGGGGEAFTFRARSHEEMMEVWNDLRMLVARYLVASEQMERDGPIAQAVRSVGYHSDEEEEDEDEEDGSSIEAEEEDEELEDDHHEHEHAAHAHAHAHAEEVPAYTASGAQIEVGPNGYALEKKQKPTSPAPRDEASSAGASRREEKAPAREEPTTGEAPSVGGGSGNGGGGGAGRASTTADDEPPQSAASSSAPSRPPRAARPPTDDEPDTVEADKDEPEEQPSMLKRLGLSY